MHGVDNLLRHVVALGVHDVLRGVVLLHQTEGIDTTSSSTAANFAPLAR